MAKIQILILVASILVSTHAYVVMRDDCKPELSEAEEKVKCDILIYTLNCLLYGI